MDRFSIFDPTEGSCYGARTLRRLRYLLIGAQAPGAPSPKHLPFLALVSLTPLLALTAGACGPIQYLNQVSGRAAGAVAAAKQVNAEKLAPYEYTAAVEYLHKAREEGGFAEYQIAIEYGRRAEDLATRARMIADRQEGAHRRLQGGTIPEPSGPAEDSP
jgi:hypothetical protein